MSETRTERGDLLRRTAELAADFLNRLPDRPVSTPVDLAALRRELGGPLPDRGEDPQEVIEKLATDVEPGLVGSAGPRYFGFVVGGGVPAALGADWLTSAWDQNAGLYALSPSAAVVEEVAAGWLVDVFAIHLSSFATRSLVADFGRDPDDVAEASARALLAVLETP